MLFVESQPFLLMRYSRGMDSLSRRDGVMLRSLVLLKGYRPCRRPQKQAAVRDVLRRGSRIVFIFRYLFDMS